MADIDIKVEIENLLLRAEAGFDTNAKVAAAHFRMLGLLALSIECLRRRLPTKGDLLAAIAGEQGEGRTGGHASEE